jgi:hypothetical protein
VGTNAPRGVRAAEYPLEVAVSTRIAKMPFLWLAVSDAPTALSDRGVIEAGAVALLSNYGKAAIDPPSEHWLGHHADRVAIRASGLWNVDHVRRTADGAFLSVFRKWLDARSETI